MCGRPESLRACTLAGLAASVAVVAGSVAGGSSFASQLPGAWFFGTPGGPLGSLASQSRDAPLGAVLAVYGGLVVLTASWLVLLRHLRARPGVPVRRVVGVIALWALPLALAPPLFSRDLYSYAGLGEMVSHHLDPYLYGTGVLGSTRFSLLAGPLWANTPSPYGPTVLWLDGLAVAAAGHRVLASLVLLRLVAVAGFALVAAGVPVLARRAGADPAAALALAAGSPLALTTFVGAGHNDAVMAGLLVAGLAAFDRWGLVPAAVLCALAGSVKVPALLGVVFVGWNGPGGLAPVRARLASAARAAPVALATLAADSWGSGLGWGWLHTVDASTKVVTGLTATADLSRVVAWVGHLAGVPADLAAVRGVVGGAGLAVAAAVGAWLLWRSPSTGTARALGLALVVVALLSPVLWPWYLTWGLVVLAAVATGRLRRGVLVLSVVATFAGASSVKHLVLSVARANLASEALLVVGLAALVAASARLSGLGTEAARPPRAPAQGGSASPVGGLGSEGLAGDAPWPLPVAGRT